MDNSEKLATQGRDYQRSNIIINGQFRETGNTGHARQRQTQHVPDTTTRKQSQTT